MYYVICNNILLVTFVEVIPWFSLIISSTLRLRPIRVLFLVRSEVADVPLFLYIYIYSSIDYLL